jgi:hypothetical protein
MSFDPDAYIAQKEAPHPDTQAQPRGDVTVSGFDPDAYITQKTTIVPSTEQSGFRFGNLKDAGVSAERMLNAIAKPPAALAEYVGWSGPSKELMARDEALKQHSGLGASLSSLGGDVAGFMLPGGAAGKVAEATQLAPKALSAIENIPGAAKLLQTGPQWLEKALGSKYTQAAGLGGTSSMLSPTGTDITDPKFAEQHTKDLATATALGPVFTAGAAGVGRALDPAMKRFKELLAQGFTKEQIMKDTTLGQIVGGAIQKFENAASFIPFGGVNSKISAGKESLSESAKDIKKSIEDIAKNKASQLNIALNDTHAGLDKAQRDVAVPSIKSEAETKIAENQAKYNNYVKTTTTNMDERHANEFSRPIIEKALEPAGIKLPDEHQGTEAIKFAQGVEKQLYDSGIKKIGDAHGDVIVGDNELNSLKSVLESSKHRLGGEGSDLYNRLASRIDEIKDSAGDTKRVSAEQWHNIFKDLGTEARDYKGPLSSGTDREYGNAVTSLKNKWMDIIENTEGSDIIKKANAVHSALQVPQTAAGYLNTYLEKGGKFDPKDFLRALKSESSGKRFAAGDARLQEEALAAYQKMANEKLKLKAQHDDFKAQLNNKKKEINTETGNKINTNKDNIAKQKAYLKSQTEAEKQAIVDEANTKKESLSKSVGELSTPSIDKYAEHRLGYSAAGLGGSSILGRVLPIDPSTQLMIAGGLLGGSHIYGAAQPILKRMAVSRPDVVRATGQAITENAPKIGGLAAYSNSQSNKKK